VVVHQATVDRESSAWFANRTDGVLGSVAKAGLIIGLAALVLTVNLSFRLPGSQSRALIAWRAADRAGGTRNALSPLVDIRSRILDHNGTEAFTVKSNVPSYWRIMALDSFDGTDWTSNNTYGSVRHSLPRDSTPAPSGLRVEQDFTIEQLTEAWLPAAYQPARIDGITGVSYDPQSGSLLYDHDTTPGLAYHVTSVLNVGQLDAARLEKAGPAPAGASLERYLTLPLSRISPRVVDLAKSIAGDKTTEYDKAIALQNYLRSDLFQYNENYDPRATGSDALDYFLFTSRQGYCQQFAGAYAVMARLVGLPTRLAVGWTWGDQDNAGVWHVRLDQAHTWPEVYFKGLGWVPFEPTSSRGIPNAQAYTGVPAEQAGSALPGGSSTLPSATTPPTSTPGQAPGKPNIPKNELGNQGSGAGRQSHHRSAAETIGLWLLGALVLVLVWAVLMVMLAWVVRRVRRSVFLADAAAVESGAPLFQPPRSRFWWTRWLARPENQVPVEGSPVSHGAGAGTGRWSKVKRALALDWLPPLGWWKSTAPADDAVVARAEALLAWAEATELLTWWGVRRRSSETYMEYGRRAIEALRLPLSFDPDASRSVLVLARAGTTAEFSARPISSAEASETGEALAALKRALISCAPALQKARFVLDPRVTLGRH
jgi:transglutaminase-like putative cysteine protease